MIANDALQDILGLLPVASAPQGLARRQRGVGGELVIVVGSGDHEQFVDGVLPPLLLGPAEADLNCARAAISELVRRVTSA